MMYDPIHEENGEWFFWDEIQLDRYGPFPTREKAQEVLDEYCRVVLGL